MKLRLEYLFVLVAVVVVLTGVYLIQQIRSANQPLFIVSPSFNTGNYPQIHYPGPCSSDSDCVRVKATCGCNSCPTGKVTAISSDQVDAWNNMTLAECGMQLCTAQAYPYVPPNRTAPVDEVFGNRDVSCRSHPACVMNRCEMVEDVSNLSEACGGLIDRKCDIGLTCNMTSAPNGFCVPIICPSGQAVNPVTNTCGTVTTTTVRSTPTTTLYSSAAFSSTSTTLYSSGSTSITCDIGVYNALLGICEQPDNAIVAPVGTTGALDPYSAILALTFFVLSGTVVFTYILRRYTNR